MLHQSSDPSLDRLRNLLLGGGYSRDSRTSDKTRIARKAGVHGAETRMDGLTVINKRQDAGSRLVRRERLLKGEVHTGIVMMARKVREECFHFGETQERTKNI